MLFKPGVTLFCAAAEPCLVHGGEEVHRRRQAQRRHLGVGHVHGLYDARRRNVEHDDGAVPAR